REHAQRFPITNKTYLGTRWCKVFIFYLFFKTIFDNLIAFVIFLQITSKCRQRLFIYFCAFFIWFYHFFYSAQIIFFYCLLIRSYRLCWLMLIIHHKISDRQYYNKSNSCSSTAKN